MISELSRRYAKALFSLSSDTGVAEQTFAQLRVIRDAINSDSAIFELFHSPVAEVVVKTKIFEASFKSKVSAEVLSFLKILTFKHRLGQFLEIVEAFEQISDEAHGVTRGKVRTASTLGPEQRKQIEETVNQVTKKKVILSFEEDPTTLGGMIAQVGGWTFDDSIDSHLIRLNDELNRRSH